MVDNFKKNLAVVSLIVSVFGVAGWGIYKTGENLEAIHAKKYESDTSRSKRDGFCADVKAALSSRTKVNLANIVRNYVSKKGGQVLVKDAQELYYLMLAEEPEQSCYNNATLRREFIEMMKGLYPEATRLDKGVDNLDSVVLKMEGSELKVRNALYM